MPVNEDIHAANVRLIGQDVQQVGIVPLAEALATARAAELDLVQVMGEADPPVCKLLDYGKLKYKQRRRGHQAKTKSHVTHIKEIRLHPKTGPHDIEYRMRHARELLAKGDRILVTVLFSGRELTHVEGGEALLNSVAAQVADAAKIETPPKREGRRLTMMLAPK